MHNFEPPEKQELLPEAPTYDVGISGQLKFAYSREMLEAYGRACFAAGQKAAEESYKRAIDEALVVRHLGVVSGDARNDLNRIICWDVAAALDPAVSSDAQALIDRGRAERQRG